MTTTQDRRMIGIPGAYFHKMATQDYSDYRQALAREFLQNSADAGAKTVEFEFDHAGRTLTVIDDGCGMTEEVLLEKLLVLGGSQKPEGSVGGFGKAKELLFFSWERYAIRTGNLIVRGSGAHYEVDRIPEGIPGVPGTHITLWFQDDEFLPLLEQQMREQLQQNQPSCRIVFNGETLDYLRKGRLVREVTYQDKPFANIHLNKSQQDTKAYIRLRGITMFTKQLYAIRKGQVVIELQGESVDLLTSNRDGLNYWAQQALDKIINELIVDCNSALREKPLKVDHYEGEGLLSTQGAITQQVDLIRKAVTATEAHVATATTARELTDILQGNQRLKHYFQDQVDRINQLATTESLLKAKEVVRHALKAMSYKPDFIVKRRDRLPKALNPESWTNVNLKLALMWEAVVKRVLLDAGKEVKFAIGWVTDSEEAFAELYRLDDGNPSFLLNPNNPNLKTRNFQFLVGELLDLAIHEVTHLDHKTHNEDFVQAVEALRRRCRMTDFGGIIREAIKAL